VADITDHERTSALRRNLEQLSSDAGTKLLQALGVKGDEADLRTASDEFSGHCLALTLLGSYLTDAYNGDIRCRKEVSEPLVHDVRQGVHARKVMESYQIWFGEGPELSVLRILGLFDRPADEKALDALLTPPAIRGLTESLIELRPTERRTILARLRRARLLAGEDLHNPGQLDTHPLVREYFGEQLRNQRIEAWKECNRRLFDYYRRLAPQLPNSFRDMEPLFLAVICGCRAGLFRQAMHEIYIPRIQRGNASFAANVLGVRGALLSVLVHFFENLRWESPVEMGIEEQSLTADDRFFILAQAALYLTTTRGYSTPEARICYERLTSLCDSLNRPVLLCSALKGMWRYFHTAGEMSVAMRLARQAYLVAQEQNDPALLLASYHALACTVFYLGDFEATRQYAMLGVQIWRSSGTASSVDEVDAPAVSCLLYKARSEWHLGDITSCYLTMEEAISLAKELNDIPALAAAIVNSAVLSYYAREVSKAERLASNVMELSTQYNFALWLAIGSILRGWARSASGRAVEGVSCIEDGIQDYLATGSRLGMPYFLGLKAEALYLANRTSEALGTVEEAEALAERSGVRCWSAELYRLRGVFLAAIGADEAKIEASFCAAINTAKGQKSVSLEKRAEATYAEYRRQKASASGGRGFRRPLC
jgi:predicted ATPase